MRRKARIKAVFFDIDNTLFPTDRFAAFARKSAIRAMAREGLPCSEAKAYALLKKIVVKYGANSPRHFDILLTELKQPRSPKLIAAGVAAYHSAKLRLAPYPGVPRTLSSLRNRGYKLYALSRGVDIKQWDKLIRLGLHNHFSGVFVAKESKGVRFYKHVLRDLHLSPSEAIMVGDNPRLDILPAKKAGITTAHFMKGRHARDPDGRLADFRIRDLHELMLILRKLS